jgi:hypothetical protein
MGRDCSTDLGTKDIVVDLIDNGLDLVLFHFQSPRVERGRSCLRRRSPLACWTCPGG